MCVVCVLGGREGRVKGDSSGRSLADLQESPLTFRLLNPADLVDFLGSSKSHP